MPLRQIIIKNSVIALKCHNAQGTLAGVAGVVAMLHLGNKKKIKEKYGIRKSNSSKKREIATISLSKFYDLSHPISEDMPVYPGEPKPEFYPHFSIGKDKVNVTKLVLGSHTGTHVDAPKHFIPTSTADAVNDIPLEKFMGECIIVDMSKKSIGNGITDFDLDEYSGMIRKNGKDIVLIYTGTSDQWDKNEDVRTNFSYLEPSAAQWLVDNRVKCIGIDSFSMEKYGFQKGLTHEKLLSNDIGIIEGISSKLKQFVGKRMFLVCLPLPLEGIDGSPVRPVLFDMF